MSAAPTTVIVPSPATTLSTHPHGHRREAVDFWRGVVLIEILVNHTPYSVIDYATHRNFGFSDGSEVFVFISGLAVSLAYWPMIERGQLWEATKKSVRRAIRLYWFHLAMTAGALAMFAIAFLLTGNPAFIAGSPIFSDTLPALIGTSLLSFQLGYFNILPLYVVLLAFVPAFFLLVHRNLQLGLGLAIVLYGAARLGLHPPDWPEGGGWFFNPFAWQLLFALGIVAGVVTREKPVRRSPVLLAAALAYLGFGLFVATGGLGQAPEVAATLGGHLDLSKYDLGTARLFHFLALAYAASLLPLDWVLTTAPAREILRLGRQGLGVFTIGSLASAFGMVTAIHLESMVSPPLMLRLAGLTVALTGLALSMLLARYLERNVDASRQSATARTQMDISFGRDRNA